MTKIDWTAERRGLLVFVKRTGTNQRGLAIWEADCDCGRKWIGAPSGSGAKSCGCLKHRVKDLRRKFGKLTGVSFSHRDGGRRGRTWWRFRCDCGVEEVLRAEAVTSNGIKSVKQCAICSHKATARKRATKGYEATNRTPEYVAYCDAKYRCNNSKLAGWKHYGGRGIKFLFTSYEQFLAEVGRRPSPQHSLDRYPNNDGHYEPGNVRWATRREQLRNTRLHDRSIEELERELAQKRKLLTKLG
jgi:hypothetical protein